MHARLFVFAVWDQVRVYLNQSSLLHKINLCSVLYASIATLTSATIPLKQKPSTLDFPKPEATTEPNDNVMQASSSQSDAATSKPTFDLVNLKKGERKIVPLSKSGEIVVEFMDWCMCLVDLRALDLSLMTPLSRLYWTRRFQQESRHKVLCSACPPRLSTLLD